MSTHTSNFGLTDRAAARIAEILGSQAAPSALRVAVLAGGCSGFQYKFDLDETPPAEDDLVIEQSGARVLVDQGSLDLLGGAQLDYSDALMGAHFAIKNPNATSACGCGSSFSVD
ncbi:HesB/IscA family protein [Acidisoma silvae]|uniref:Iron-sulfur cluster assembly accessory protein n=1 Tax=Acidisoma silvae TaxID=2802396 RepID=A0A963YQR5_9PROT|nr:iron-sulfur cluster assembly accessory protein [Acidisoma silvae]MCB8874793.1 iron-sulfur cluster assembly accessory protein [Acidisoma silvae]